MKNISNRTPNLRKVRVKGVGFFEGLRLRIAGRMDGVRNLPREDGAGCWTSPFIDRELHSYEEFLARMYGELQSQQRDDYIYLRKAVDTRSLTKAQLLEAKAKLNAALARERSSELIRKQGEDKLTDVQVRTRRTSEQEMRLEPLRRRVGYLQNQLEEASDELSELRNRILEDNLSAKLRCEQVQMHVRQRISVYWDAVIKHSENNLIPIVPTIMMPCHTEDCYMDPYKELLLLNHDNLADLIPCEKNEKEVAA